MVNAVQKLINNFGMPMKIKADLKEKFILAFELF